jgi:plasmid stabilization system protein ParE
MEDLQLIEPYLSGQSSRAAASVVEQIYDRFDQLKAFPLIGPIVHEFDEPSLRELPEGAYRIVYRVIDAERIDKLAVIHLARQLPDDL